MSGVDTRMLTKIIRDTGRPMAAIVEADMPKEEALSLIAATPRPTEIVTAIVQLGSQELVFHSQGNLAEGGGHILPFGQSVFHMIAVLL